MKRRPAMLLAAALCLVALLSGCPDDPGVGVLVVEYLGEPVQDGDTMGDFGLLEAGGPSVSLTFSLTNTGDAVIVVDSVTLSDTLNYSIAPSEYPLEIAAGAEVEATLTCTPSASGALPVTISITAAGQTVDVGATAEGNFRPVIIPGVVVEGAEVAGANGLYVRSAEEHNSVPCYILEGNPTYYLFGEEDGGYTWYISTALGGTAEPECQFYSLQYSTSGALPNYTTWTVVSTEDLSALTVVAEISQDEDHGGGELWTSPPGDEDTITAEYHYYDEDGDPEDTVTFQWYRVDAVTGAQTAISGATSQSYTLVNPDDDGFDMTVVVTPIAASGILEGPPSTLGPTVTTINNL